VSHEVKKKCTHIPSEFGELQAGNGSSHSHDLVRAGGLAGAPVVI
jgi:hypothetical protein